jgi:hypothetical protein
MRLILTIMLLLQLQSLPVIVTSDWASFTTVSQMDRQIDVNRSNARMLCEVILHAQDESLLRYALPILQRESAHRPHSAQLLAALGFARYCETGLLAKWTAVLPKYVPDAVKGLRVKRKGVSGYVPFGINRLRVAYDKRPKDPGITLMYAIALDDQNRSIYYPGEDDTKKLSTEFRIEAKNLNLDRAVIAEAKNWCLAWAWYGYDLSLYNEVGQVLNKFNPEQVSSLYQSIYRCYTNAKLFGSTDFLANYILFFGDGDFEEAGHPGLGLKALKQGYHIFAVRPHLFPVMTQMWTVKYDHDVHWLESEIAKQKANHQHKRAHTNGNSR